MVVVQNGTSSSSGVSGSTTMLSCSTMKFARWSSSSKVIISGRRMLRRNNSKERNLASFVPWRASNSARIAAAGAAPVVPRRTTNANWRSFDRERYEQQTLIERLFRRIKRFRCFATRYDKLARTYAGFLSLVTTLIWLR